MRSRVFLFIVGIILIALLEIICASALGIRQGAWKYCKLPNYNYKLFEPDPLLVGVPRKSISVEVKDLHYQHNTQGFRGDDFSHQTQKKIACIGGSTTYCVGVNNNETWPYYLDSLLADFGVMNFGIPGHSTVEHKKLLPEVIRQYSPDIVIIQAGLNDLRCMNVHNLANDYSNFHQPTLYGSFGFCPQYRLPPSGLITAVWIALRKMKVVNCCPFHSADFSGTVSDSVDNNVVNIFSRNLDIIIGQCAAYNIPVLLVPQVLSEEVISETNYKWWVPYLTKKGILKAVVIMNNIIKSKTDVGNIQYVEIGVNWEANDFVDPSHLSGKGNMKLAEGIKESITEYFQKASPI